MLFFCLTVLFCRTGFAQAAAAQPALHVICNLLVDEGTRDNSKIVIERDGKPWKVRNGDDAKAYLELDAQHEYMLSFMKKNYVTKKVYISTKIPEDLKKTGFKPFVFDVTILKQKEGVDIMVFDQPVARILYDDQTEDFAYDTDYTSSVLKQIQSVEKKLKSKAKEPKPQVQAPAPTPDTPPVKTQNPQENAGKSPIQRDEKKYTEGNKQITEVTVTKEGKTQVYKKIVYVWGVYYFCDGVSITEGTYVQNAVQ